MLSTKEFIHPFNESTRSWGSAPIFQRSQTARILPVEPGRAASTDATAYTPSDEELTALAQSGASDAFDKLIQRHRRACMKRAFLTMHNQDDAEDVVQSACRRAFQCLQQFRGNGTFGGWLGRIVQNECRMRIREGRNTRFVPLDSQNESSVRLELVDQTTNPEDELGWEEVVKLLRKEMLRMPPIFRNVMLLHDSEQLPMPDVAERLGLSIPGAKSRLLRARRELRSRIGKHCGRKGPGTLLASAVHSRTAYASTS